MTDSKEPTHTAYARQRMGRTFGPWLEIGEGRLDSTGVFHGILNRTPIGGLNGYVYFAPIGEEPPQAEPARPASSSEEEADLD
jgi:hypothetical protein